MLTGLRYFERPLKGDNGSPAKVNNYPLYHLLSMAYIVVDDGFSPWSDQINTVVSNHVNSDHVPSFSCLGV
jgi:hypothetical protein